MTDSNKNLSAAILIFIASALWITFFIWVYYKWNRKITCEFVPPNNVSTEEVIPIEPTVLSQEPPSKIFHDIAAVEKESEPMKLTKEFVKKKKYKKRKKKKKIKANDNKGLDN